MPLNRGGCSRKRTHLYGESCLPPCAERELQPILNWHLVMSAVLAKLEVVSRKPESCSLAIKTVPQLTSQATRISLTREGGVRLGAKRSPKAPVNLLAVVTLLRQRSNSSYLCCAYSGQGSVLNSFHQFNPLSKPTTSITVHYPHVTSETGGPGLQYNLPRISELVSGEVMIHTWNCGSSYLIWGLNFFQCQMG